MGDPDLRGMWPVDYLAATPRERPAELGTRAEWTEAEYKERNAAAEQRIGLEAAQDKIGILGMGHWREDGRPLWQSSMITQPENGRYPALTEEGQRAAAAVKNSWNTEVFDKITDFGPWDRCLTRGMPGSMLTGAYNMGPARDAEPGPGGDRDRDGPETRKIYLDGRDAPPPEVTEYLGFSRGRWEGDTLVIETTNFTPGFSNGPTPNSAQMKVTERITPTGPNQMRYEAWIEDPVMLTAPYKIDIPWQRNPDYRVLRIRLPRRQRADLAATSPPPARASKNCARSSGRRRSGARRKPRARSSGRHRGSSRSLAPAAAPAAAATCVPVGAGTLANGRSAPSAR